MKQKQNFGFYMETIIMLLVFMIAISNIVRVFTASYGKSRNAEHLTDAVILASNGAELVLASQSPEEIMSVLKDAGPELEDSVITAHFDDNLEMSKDGPIEMKIDWQETEADFAHAVITVSYSAMELYTLTTGKYLESAS